MSIQHQQLMTDLRELRELAAKRYAEDPLPATDAAARVRLREDIDRYGLADHILELELDGITVVPPGKAAPLEFVERLREAILRVSAERAAKGHAESEALKAHIKGGVGAQLFHPLPDDPVFQEAVTNPVVLTLVTYLAGYRARLFTCTGLVKTNESDRALFWHTDNGARTPPPYPIVSNGANANWLLTDYSRENGALCVVPGSHHWCREPDPRFSFDDERVRVIEAPAGSVAVWHANLWHAAVPRTTEGERVTLVTGYERPPMRSQDAYWLTTTQEMLERNPPRFPVLVGLLDIFPTTIDGPDLALNPAFCRDLGRWT